MRPPDKTTTIHRRFSAAHHISIAMAPALSGIASVCSFESTPRGASEYTHNAVNSPKQYDDLLARPADRYVDPHNEGIPAADNQAATPPRIFNLYTDTFMPPDEADDNGIDDDFDRRIYNDPDSSYKLNHVVSNLLPIPTDIYTYFYQTTFGDGGDDAPYWTWDKNCTGWLLSRKDQ